VIDGTVLAIGIAGAGVATTLVAVLVVAGSCVAGPPAGTVAVGFTCVGATKEGLVAVLDGTIVNPDCEDGEPPDARGEPTVGSDIIGPEPITGGGGTGVGVSA
jgi:hypothetical protein